MPEKKLIGKHELKRAEKFLSNIDLDWKQLIQHIGSCRIKINTSYEPYQALIKSVIFQQLNPKAANSIYEKFLNIFQKNFPTAEQIFTMDNDQLKICGLSKNKMSCIQNIAELHIQNKLPNKFEIQKMTESEIKHIFQPIKGVGPWTIDMLLIFNLGRADILPSNDLALKINYSKLKKLPERINHEDLAKHSAAWQPYRSIAAWYLWQLN